jgi:hypothetical protein
MEQMDERTVISSSDNNSTRLPFFEELVWCCPCCSSSQSESEHCSLCVNLHWDKILTDDAALETIDEVRADAHEKEVEKEEEIIQ